MVSPKRRAKMRLPRFEILVADVRAGLIQLRERGVKVDLIVSSPPYWAQRNYEGQVGQIGHEPTSQEYVDTMVDIFYNYCIPILKPHGLIFLNIGDSYNGSGGQGNQTGASRKDKSKGVSNKSLLAGVMSKNDANYKARDLVNVPHRVYEGLRQKGLYWRSTIVWSKTNGMPESVVGVRWMRHRVKVESNNNKGYKEWMEKTGATSYQARLTTSGVPKYIPCPGCKKCEPNGGYILRWGSGRPVNKTEMIGVLTQDRYYWDNEAVRTKYAASSTPAQFRNNHAGYEVIDPNIKMGRDNGTESPEQMYSGANLTNVWEMDDTNLLRWLAREYPDVYTEYAQTQTEISDVWKLPTAQFREKHFATFPTMIPELAIKAGTSEFGNCSICGSPYARKLDQVVNNEPGSNYGILVYKTVGWAPTCVCAGEPEPAVVLDPFNGAATTGLEANRLGRDYIGIEIVPAYAEMGMNRIRQDAPLFNTPTETLPMYKYMEELNGDTQDELTEGD